MAKKFNDYVRTTRAELEQRTLPLQTAVHTTSLTRSIFAFVWTAAAIAGNGICTPHNAGRSDLSLFSVQPYLHGVGHMWGRPGSFRSRYCLFEEKLRHVFLSTAGHRASVHGWRCAQDWVGRFAFHVRHVTCLKRSRRWSRDRLLVPLRSAGSCWRRNVRKAIDGGDILAFRFHRARLRAVEVIFQARYHPLVFFAELVAHQDGLSHLHHVRWRERFLLCALGSAAGIGAARVLSLARLPGLPRRFRLRVQHSLPFLKQAIFQAVPGIHAVRLLPGHELFHRLDDDAHLEVVQHERGQALPGGVLAQVFQHTGILQRGLLRNVFQVTAYGEMIRTDPHQLVGNEVDKQMTFGAHFGRHRLGVVHDHGGVLAVERYAVRRCVLTVFGQAQHHVHIRNTAIKYGSEKSRYQRAADRVPFGHAVEEESQGQSRLVVEKFTGEGVPPLIVTLIHSLLQAPVHLVYFVIGRYHVRNGTMRHIHHGGAVRTQRHATTGKFVCNETSYKKQASATEQEDNYI